MFSRTLLYAQKCRAYSSMEIYKSCFIKPETFSKLLVLNSVNKRQNYCNQQHTNNQSKSNYRKCVTNFFLSISISAGIYVILSLRKNNWIPSVFAASPLQRPNISSFISQDESRVSDKKDIRKTYNFIADAAEKVAGAVVYIIVQDNIRKDHSGKPSLVSTGSGFIIEEDGLIMTNAHVVGNKPRASIIVVRLSDGTEFEGKIEELDAMTDLALIRINCKNLKTIKFGSSQDLRAGEFVVAVGSPLSLSNSVTSGVISSVGRKSQELGLMGRETQYLQTDATITFGNSGGPLINLDGDVIGINSMKVATGISFAIPIDYAKDFLEKAIKKREFMSERKTQTTTLKRRRYLGITMFNLSEELIIELQQREDNLYKIPLNITYGLLVSRVYGGSPSFYAGISPGDIITHINGKEIHSISQAYLLLEAQCDLNMVVIRDGQRYSVVVAPED